ncbi:ABC transporter substrate-binding protein [Paenibacillus sp. 1001270B_150601_E10]|uniref:ABC transporter substrate-binding protein n=1 Tax=Paenibacillus sp. 1001270B_150601_E10 TaxID=2787079 RepID=UPI00189C77A5|nr:extracellular solute-binding protein [Paenibacillus sp. 1001270B_150601_E10]
MFRLNIKAKVSLSTMLLTCWSFFLVSCATLGEQQAAVTLKIMAWNDYQFNVQYKQPFEALHPKIKLEPIILDTSNGVPYDEMLELIQKQSPDVIAVTPGLFQKLAEEGALVQLDPLIKRDQYPIEDMHPPAIEYLRAKGLGSLFGLSSYVKTQALFYNKDLFDQYRVPYPKDGMTWEEVIKLSERFKTSNGSEAVQGLVAGGYRYGKGHFSVEMAELMQLSYLDRQGERVVIQTKPWKELFETIDRAFRLGAIVVQEEEEPNGFMEGKAAMTIGTPTTALQLGELDRAKSKRKEWPLLNWQMVTSPGGPAESNPGTWSLDHILAIPESSAYPEEAWTFIQFITSKEHTIGGGSLWSGHMREISGRSQEPFYKYPPKVEKHEPMNVPGKFHEQFYMIVNEHLEQVLERKATIDEALAAIQQEGQQKLDALRQELDRE